MTNALLLGSLILGLVTASGDDERDLELAAALVRRGWVELAEGICTRIEKDPSSSAVAKSGVPLVLAEVAVAKARVAADVVKAAGELDQAVARLRRSDRPPSLDERGMVGWLHVQKAKLLSAAAEDDATRREDALKAWEAAEAYYRVSLAELEKLAPSPAVDETVLDARLEIPKAMSAQARMLPTDQARRNTLLAESIRLYSEFQLTTRLQPVLLEALFEEGRSRAALRDFGRAELRFRSMAGLRRDLKKAGFPPSEYVVTLLQSGTLALARTLIDDGKVGEAVSTCDDFLNENPSAAGSAIGYAILLTKADALRALHDKTGAIALAQQIALRDAGGSAGRQARTKIALWTADTPATPQLMMLIADGLMEQGRYREALGDLRRCAEACATPAERRQYEPVAAYKRGECFRALKQDAESSAAFQEVFRRYPGHELSRRAAFEAVRSLSRASAASTDPRDAEEMERLLDEVDTVGLQGPDAGYVRFIRAEILERKGRLREAADLYREVDPACGVYDDAMISAGHCYRRDAELKWEKGRGPGALREEAAAELARAEEMLKRVLPRLEAPGSNRPANPRLLSAAYYEFAILDLHEGVARPRESLELLEKCLRLLPPESEMRPRLGELEIQARLATAPPQGAVAALEKLLADAPDSPSAARSCRRVASKLATSDPAGCAKYYRLWLDRASATATLSELQAAADGLYGAARTLNGLDGKIRSVMDLNGKALPDHGVWRDAARAHERLIQVGGLSEDDAAVAASRLVWCAGFTAETPADWTRAKELADAILQKHAVFRKNGMINPQALEAKKWLAGVCFEYGHSLYQLGKGGQKFQYGNALRVFNELVDVSSRGSEPWWTARFMGVRVLFERGEGNDLQSAGAAISSVEWTFPEFDEGKYGFKSRFVDLREQVRTVTRPRR